MKLKFFATILSAAVVFSAKAGLLKPRAAAINNAVLVFMRFP